MARNTTIAVSDEELESLKEVRMEIFGTDEVPYGVVIQRLIEDRDE